LFHTYGLDREDEIKQLKQAIAKQMADLTVQLQESARKQKILEEKQQILEEEKAEQSKKLQDLTAQQDQDAKMLQEQAKMLQDLTAQQQQHGDDTSRVIGSMQRKLFEAQKANQDAFHARETLVQPDEQLDNNDRDMIDALVKNPGIGAIVLSIVLFVSGVQVKSSFKPDKEFLGDDGERADSDAGDDESDADCCACKESSCITRPLGCLKGFGRLMAASVPIMMLSVQFSYIFFIFDEAYNSYSGGVCPAYSFTGSSIVPPYDGTDARIRILMGFIGLYFTARTLSQMFAFLKALTERTVSNKDKSTRTWMEVKWAWIKSKFAGLCGRGSNKGKNQSARSPNGSNGGASGEEADEALTSAKASGELKITRLKGKQCSKPECKLQGLYYTSKKTDIVNLVLERMKFEDSAADAPEREGRAREDRGKSREDAQDREQLMKEKALMEFGLPMFVGHEGFTIRLDAKQRRLQVSRAIWE
jgi:hypothetical protein